MLMVSLRPLDLRPRCVLRRQKADCAKGTMLSRENGRGEESPGRRRLRTGRRVQMHKFSRLAKMAWHPGVARLRKYQWSRRLSHGTWQVCCTYVTYVHAVATCADNATTRRPSEVRKFLAAVRFLVRQETPFTSCVSRYLPILLRGAKRLVFAAEVCKVHAVRHPRRWKFPFGNVMTDFAGRNRREWIEKRRATRQLRLSSLTG